MIAQNDWSDNRRPDACRHQMCAGVATPMTRPTAWASWSTYIALRRCWRANHV